MRRCIHIAPLTLIVLLAMMHEARAQAPDAGVPPVVGASEEATTAIAAPARRFSPDGKPLTTLIFPPGQQVQIDSILAKIRTDTGITVEARGQARGQPIPSPLLKDATVEEAVRWIASQRDLMYYQESPTVWIITDKQTYTQTQLTKQVIRTVIRPINVPATEAAKLVQSMTTPNVGKIDVDARTNQLIVTDLPVVVAAIRDAVKLLDQKVYTRVFTIKHADAQKVMDILQEYKSPPGKLELIPRMRQIVAEDTFENIQRMEVMVNILDRGPEMRVYDLNSLDVAGERIKDLQGYFEKEIITEGAYMQFDLQNGVMILIDLPHVHEKVQKILD
ncbi:hypothetical protein FJY63_06600, partial [Candidatus Sumerlaeota bacterium]|nr:hypothetical protein [Candidatus Sumerlaeota bacterium]